VGDLPLGDPLSELPGRVLEAGRVIADQKPLDAGAWRDELGERSRTGGSLLGVVGGDLTTDRDPSIDVQSSEHRIRNGSANVVEIAVHAVGGGLVERRAVVVGGIV